jgi:hypothetical protein
MPAELWYKIMTVLSKLSGLAVCLLLFLSFASLSLCETLPTPYDEWQMENKDGVISQSSGVIRLSTNGGGEYPYSNYPSMFLYKEFAPTEDFTFSVEVNANTLESCTILLRRETPIIGVLDGVTFEFGYHHAEGVFLTARNYSGWTSNEIAQGDPHVWYTMRLTVTQSPYTITTAVYDENGSCLGLHSASDVDFKFEDIKYIGFGVWGYNPADYSFRNVQAPEGSQGIMNQTASSISISAVCSPKIGSTVDISGVLRESNSTPLSNKTVVLSYNFPGLNSWIPISSDLTDENGTYCVQWINSASGTFTLKAQWAGDSATKGISNTTSLSFLPYKNQQIFTFESNSTVSGLVFNNATSTLTFNVTGPSDTSGFVRAVIAKSMLSDGANLQTSIDGRQLNYTVSSTEDSWVYYFTYSHSTHQISMHLASEASEQSPVNMIILGAVIAVFTGILGAIVYSFSRKSNPTKHLMTQTINSLVSSYRFPAYLGY